MPLERDPQSEIEKLERRVAENPEGRMFAHLADAYRKAGELEQAERLVLEGLERHPNYLSAHLVLGRVYLDSERPEEARRQFQQVLDLDPDNLIALKALGDLTVGEGSPAEARPWYERMLQVDPYNEEAQAALDALEAGAVPGSAAAVPPERPVGMGEGGGRPAEEVALPEPEAGDAGAGEGDAEGFSTAAEVDPWADFTAEISSVSRELEEAEADAADRGETETGDGPAVEAPERLPWEETIEPEAIETAGEAAEAADVEGEVTDEDLDLDLVGMDEWSPGLVSDDLDVDELDADEPHEGRVEPGIVFGGATQGGEGDDEVVTETMAELYARQGLYEEALKIYRQLASVRPHDDTIRARVQELEERTGVSVRGDVDDMELSAIEDEGEVLEIGEVAEVVTESDGPAPFEFDVRAPDAQELARLDPFAASFTGRPTVEETAAETAAEPGPTGPEGVPSEPEGVGAAVVTGSEAGERIGGEREEIGVEAPEAEPAPPVSAVLLPETAESMRAYLRRLLRHTPGELGPGNGNPARPAAGGSGRPDEEGGATGAEPSRTTDESEDLEQFQEWLRSLKR